MVKMVDVGNEIIDEDEEETEDRTADNESPSTNQHLELLPLENFKSPVWNHFGFPAKDGRFVDDKGKRKSVCCKLCGRYLPYKGNTTNMASHLQHHHSSVYRSVYPAGSSSGTTKWPLPHGQTSIEGSMKNLQPLSRDSQRWKTLTKSVCYCITKDMLPLDTINDPGFRHMLHTFEPSYTPPDRSTLSRHYVPELYEREKARVSTLMAKHMDHFAVTTDAWSSRANHSYICLTVHYISKDWDICSHMLETAETSEDHTGVNLATGLTESFGRWSLSTVDISAVVSDSAANIVLAVDILKLPRLACLSHVLHLAVQKALVVPEIVKAIARAKRLVGHFRHSVKSTNILRQKQRDLKFSEDKLKQVCKILL